MKKLIKIALIACAFAAVLCIGAHAEGELSDKGGVYDVTGTGAELTFYTADSETAIESASAVIKEGEAAVSGFYKEAVRFDVTANGGTANSQYLLLVLSEKEMPDKDNIVYINQAAADEDGAIAFTGTERAYPNSMGFENYYVYIVGAGKTFDKDAPAKSFKAYSAYTLGDADGDGEVTAADASSVLQHVAQLTTLTGTRYEAAKVSAAAKTSGEVTAADASLILQKVAQLIDKFPAEN